MKILSINLWQGGVSLLLSGLIGCSHLSYLGLAMPPITTIQELQQQTSGSAIYLQGKVIQNAPFIDSGAYQVQDRTGTVWVLTNRALPKPGEEITIKGQLAYRSISIGGIEQRELYIVETEPISQDSSTSQATQASSTPPAISQPQPPTQVTKPAVSDEFFLPHKRYSK